MSLSRIGEDGRWFDVNPGYVYVTANPRFEGVDEFNTSIRTVPHFCELAMRALEQSGELDDETLNACEQALRNRFGSVFQEDDE